MNALLIHYYYPPIRSGAVLRNYYFSREFSQYFDQVYVLTTDNRQMLAQEPLPLPDNVTVLEAKTFDYRRWIGNQTSSHLPEEKKQKPLLTWLGKLMKTLPFHFIMGEGGLLYIFSAVRIGKKLIKAKKIDFIYSSFGPYADHFIAYTIKGKNKQLPWVADFRDLQVEPLYRNVFLRKWQVAIERFLLRRANLVTTISDGLKKHLEIYGRPVMSVPRGVKMHAGKKETFDKFTICYTGSLYQDYRDANLFFSELARLLDQGHIERSSIQFIYAGRDSGQFSHWIQQYGLEDCFVNRGFLTREETLNLQRRSHLQ
ncbi:MAG: hypothetical protein KDC53_09695, partial [Saprospiraceae bacterium]|nr:hypothetical protein [Saprospiraceae bacterium]